MLGPELPLNNYLSGASTAWLFYKTTQKPIQTVVQVDMAAKRKCLLMLLFIICMPFALCINCCIQAIVKKHDKPRKWLYDGAKKTCQRCKSVRTVKKDEMEDFVDNHKMVQVKHKHKY